MKRNKECNLLEGLTVSPLFKALHSSENDWPCTALHRMFSACETSENEINFVASAGRRDLENHKQQAMMRHILSRLENLLKRLLMTGWSNEVATMTTLFLSDMLSPNWVKVWFGQEASFNCRKFGPCHYIEDVRSREFKPRDKRSAGLFEEVTCRQRLISLNRCISITLFATKTDYLREQDVIQFRTIVEWIKRRSVFVSQ